MPRQEACLQLGRQLGHLRAGTYAIGRIPGKDLGLLVAAGVRTVYPGYGRGILPEEQLNDVSQKIARMLPRRQRRAFEQAALSFRDAGVFDGDKWRGGLGHTGFRAALVASGDVLGAFEQIARADRRLAAAVLQPAEELWAAARTSAPGGRDDRLRGRRGAGRPQPPPGHRLAVPFSKSRSAWRTATPAARTATCASSLLRLPSTFRSVHQARLRIGRGCRRFPHTTGRDCA